MSVLKRCLTDPFIAKSTLSRLKSVGLAASYSTRARKPDGIKNLETWLNTYDSFIPWKLSCWNCDQDIIDTVPPVIPLTSLYHQVRIKTGWKDIRVEKKLEKMTETVNDLQVWVLSRDPSLLVMLYLKHGIDGNSISSTRNVRRVHALALTTGMLKDDWNRSRMIPLYLQAATSSLEAELWVYVKDICEAISTVNHLVSLYRQQTAAETTGWKDRVLEKKLEKMAKTVNDLEDWAASKNPSSLVKIYLKYALGSYVNTISSTRNVRRVHALALRTGTVDNEWSRSRLMAYYLESVSGSLQDCERLFHGAEKKGLLLFNQMLTVYSRHDPEKAKRLFDEMIGTCPPDSATYMALLHALSVGGKPVEAIKVVQNMESRGVQPDPLHYGVLVDSFARMRTPDSIKIAIHVLKYFPAAQNEVTINSVFSRCVSPPGVKAVSPEEELKLKQTMKQAKDEKTIKDAQDVLDLQQTIRHAQDLVDYLEEKEYKYAVQEKTHWRLANCGLKWPTRVTKN